jgi:hypothetical protein
MDRAASTSLVPKSELGTAVILFAMLLQLTSQRRHQ